MASKEKRKAPAFLVSLLSKVGLEGLVGGTGGAAGSTVVGTQAGGFSALWGGLLATKAGIVALVLTATTIAGGISYFTGVPQSVSNFAGGAGGGIASLFTGSSREGQPAAESQGAGGSGSQDSIQSLQSANPAQAESQNQAANPSADAAAPSAANTTTPDNSYGSGSGSSAHPKLATTQGLNASNSSNQGGGANMVASLPPGMGNAGAGSNTASNGARSLSAMGQSSNPGFTSSRRFGGASGGRGAFSQAMGTLGTVRGNLAQAGGPTSSGSGATYDGAGNTRMIGGGPGGIAGGGVGTGGTGVNGAGTPNQPSTVKVLPPAPPVGPTKNATPWQGAVMAAMGAMTIALMAFMMMHNFKKKAFSGGLIVAPAALHMAKLMGMIATAAAGVAAMMGLLMMSGYGQMKQGMMWVAIGGAFTAVAAYSLFKLNDEAHDAEKKAQDIVDEQKPQFEQLLKDNPDLAKNFDLNSNGQFVSKAGATDLDRAALLKAIKNLPKIPKSLPVGSVIKP